MRKRAGVTFIVIAILVFASKLSAQSNRPPNIILILADDLGWMDTSIYGSRFYETPNIDRLGLEGMRFTDGYAGSPVCSPTRASVLTGQYPARLHLTNITQEPQRNNPQLLQPESLKALPLDVLTIPKALHQAGYVSASFGKWHLGDDRAHWPDRQGFDIGDPVVPPPCGKEEPDHMCDPKAIAHLTDQACDFMEKNRERPFFLYLAHYAVHLPIEARRELIAHYQAKVDPNNPQHNADYAAMVGELDRGVGRLLSQLDSLGLAENTVVFFMSDNGGLLRSRSQHRDLFVTSNAPLRGGKGTLNEGGVREPWLVRWPGHIRPGAVSRVPVSSIDFLPTILEIAGVPLPSGVTIDGLSIAPILFNEVTALPRDALFWHFPHYAESHPASSVRMGDWKLIEYWEDQHVELYNLAEDLRETHDLADKFPAKRTELREQLHSWLRNTGALLPKENPNYKAWKRWLKRAQHFSERHTIAISCLGITLVVVAIVWWLVRRRR